MIVFQNPGLIDMAAVTTMGVSVKDGDTPIGYFGTGLKFAIATILREGGELTIYRGLERYGFTKQPLTVRGETFEQVCMNDQPLGFTTQLGRNWQAWMAFRELASNCRDEGGRYFSAQAGGPVEDGTTVCVTGGGIDDAFAERSTILLESQPLYANEHIEIHEGPSRFVYYRGVRIHTPFRETALRYNIKRTLELTEDRTAKWSFEVNDAIINGLLAAEDETLLRRALSCGDGYLEHHLEFPSFADASPEFTRVANVLTMDAEQCLTANPAAVKQSRARSLAAMKPGDGMVLAEREEKMLDRAVSMLKAGGFDLTSFPVLLVETLGPGIHGLAKDGKVYISRLAFDKGTRELAATLLEEFAHLRSGHGDYTRGFQNWLFDQLLIHVETAAKEPF